MIYEKFEPKNDAKARMKNARPSAALVREAPKPQRHKDDLAVTYGVSGVSEASPTGLGVPPSPATQRDPVL